MCLPGRFDVNTFQQQELRTEALQVIDKPEWRNWQTRQLEGLVS